MTQYETYENAFKRIFSSDTLNKLKILAKDKDYNISLSAFLKHIIDELYDIKYNSKIKGQ